MPFPLSVTDDFDRANGAPGGLWTPDIDGADQPEFTISSNQLVGVATDPWMYYDLSLGVMCEASVTLAAYSAGSFELEAVVNAGTASWGGYAVSSDGTDSSIVRYIPDAPDPDPIMEIVPGSFSGGDELGIRVLAGGLVEFWGRAAAGSWTQLADVVDPDPIVGDFKMALYATHGSTAFDNFSVASLAVGGGMLPFYRRRRRKE